MPTTVILRNVNKETDGTIAIDWGSGKGQQFRNIDELRNYVRQADVDTLITQQCALAWLVARNQELSDISLLRNKQFVFDLAAVEAIAIR